MRTRLVLGLLLLVLPSVLWASGTLIYEQGSKATAQAGAFVARADDATAVFYNPAGIAFAKGMQFSFNETYINTDVHYETSYYVPGYPYPDHFGNLAGSYANNAKNFFLEGLYFSMPINDVLSFGIMANAPFNLATDWSNIFPGRFSSRHAKIITYDIRPVFTVRFNEYNAMGFGVDYYDSEINLVRALNTSVLSTAVNPNTYPAPPYPAGIPYYAYSEGKINTWLRDQAWGWNISYLFKKAPWSFGAAYRSRASFDYEGHTHFDSSPAIGPLYALFPNQTTRLSLRSVPAIATAGFAYDDGTFTIELDAQWTEWSTWDQGTAKFSVPTSLPTAVGPMWVVPPTEQFIFKWGNAWCWRLGFGYKLNPNWELRWGLLYDQAPIPDDTTSPVLPDSNRWSVQFGAGYSDKHWGIDWYLMYLKFKNNAIASDNQNRYYYTGLPYVYLPGQGQIYPVTYPVTPDGRYTGQAYLGGFQLNYKW